VAYQRLSGLLSSEVPAVRRAAAQSLAKRPEQQTTALLAMLIDDPDVEIKLVALGSIDSVGALEAYAAANAGELRLRLAALSRIAKSRGQNDTARELGADLARTESRLDRALLAAAWLSATP
jgi:hypothetical protein